MLMQEEEEAFSKMLGHRTTAEQLKMDTKSLSADKEKRQLIIISGNYLGFLLSKWYRKNK